MNWNRVWSRRGTWAALGLSIPCALLVVIWAQVTPDVDELVEIESRALKQCESRYGRNVTPDLVRLEKQLPLLPSGYFSGALLGREMQLSVRLAATSSGSAALQEPLGGISPELRAHVDKFIEISRSGGAYITRREDANTSAGHNAESDYEFVTPDRYHKISQIQRLRAASMLADRNFAAFLTEAEKDAHVPDSLRPYFAYGLTSGARDRYHAYELFDLALGFQPDAKSCRDMSGSLRELRNTDFSWGPDSVPNGFWHLVAAHPFSVYEQKGIAQPLVRQAFAGVRVNEIGTPLCSGSKLDNDLLMQEAYSVTGPWTRYPTLLATFRSKLRSHPELLSNRLAGTGIFRNCSQLSTAIQTYQSCGWPAYGDLLATGRYVTTYGRLLEAALAARAFHEEQGRWPDNVRQLVPQCLPDLPADLLTTSGLQTLDKELEHGALCFGPLKMGTIPVTKDNVLRMLRLEGVVRAFTQDAIVTQTRRKPGPGKQMIRIALNPGEQWINLVAQDLRRILPKENVHVGIAVADVWTGQNEVWEQSVRSAPTPFTLDELEKSQTNTINARAGLLRIGQSGKQGEPVVFNYPLNVVVDFEAPEKAFAMWTPGPGGGANDGRYASRSPWSGGAQTLGEDYAPQQSCPAGDIVVFP